MKPRSKASSPPPAAGGMPADSLDIVLPKKLPIVQQLATRIREKIASGEMPSGMRLPTTQQLAVQWGTYVPAVHGALSMLAREGLLDRRHRKGTFVRTPDTRLSRVGILAANQLWQDLSEYLFVRQVFILLEDHLLQRNIRTTVWFETRGEKVGTPLAALAKAVERHEIQALIALNGGDKNAAWLNDLPIPVTGFGKPLKNHVDYSFDSFYEVACGILRRAGCTSVALISALPGEAMQHLTAFQRAARKAGLETREDWVRVGLHFPEPHDEFGYKQFRSLWQQPGKPQGLIVYPDTVARGAMLGLSMSGVRIPQELNIVFHKNAEIPFLCPLQVNFVVNSCLEVARAFCEQLIRIHAGESCAEVLLDFQASESVHATVEPPGKKAGRSRSK